MEAATTAMAAGLRLRFSPEGFESTVVPGSVWSSADANATNGADYWGEQTAVSGARVHGERAVRTAPIIRT